MARKNLHEQLVTKANTLRNTEVSKAAASTAYIAAADVAIAESRIAANHAKAVEQAVAILEEAGVAL